MIRRIKESMTRGDFMDQSLLSRELSGSGTSRAQRRLEVTNVQPVRVSGDLYIGDGFITKNSPNLVIKLSVSGNNTYTVYIKVLDFWKFLAKKLVEEGYTEEDCKSSTSTSMKDFVTSVFNSAMSYFGDKGLKIQVSCNCRDFIYRKSRDARNGQYLYVNEEDDTNNIDKNDPACKHIMSSLFNISRWYYHIIKDISDILRTRPEEVFKFNK